MGDENGEPKKSSKPIEFGQIIGSSATRKLRARHSQQGVWFGLGMMGLVGWSVVVPTLGGAAAGFWIDGHHPGVHSWTLTLLIVGLGLGCINAWHWVSKEDREMREAQDE